MRLAQPVLARMLRTCVATVFRLISSTIATSALPRPIARRRSTSSSRAVRLSGEVGVAALRRRGHPDGNALCQCDKTERLGTVLCQTQQRCRTLAVTGKPACQQHGGEVVAGVGQRRRRAHPLVHRQCVREMSLRVGPARHRGSEQPEKPPARSPASSPATQNDVVAVPGQQVSVQHAAASPRRPGRAHLCQIDQARRPSCIPWQGRKVVSREILEHRTGRSQIAEFDVQQHQSGPPGRRQRGLTDELRHERPELGQAPLFAAQAKDQDESWSVLWIRLCGWFRSRAE